MSLTRQDLQTCMDNARMRLLDSLPTRQDIHSLREGHKGVANLLQQTQQQLRQDANHHVELVRRMATMESRMGQLEHDVQDVRRLITALSNTRSTERVTERLVPATPEERQQFIYKLAGQNTQPGYQV